MCLYNLPAELLEEVANLLDSEKDVNNLVRSCRRFHLLLNYSLYRHNARHAQNSAVIWAAQNGRESTLNCASDAGTELWDSELGLLHIAASRGHEGVARQLLECVGTDVNSWDKTGRPPMLYAVQNSQLGIVRVLIDYGASISIPSRDLEYPLNRAIESGNLEIATLLLNSGADISALSKSGWSPLHYAADRGYTLLVNQLISRGADATLLTKTHWSPLALALDNGHYNTSKVLLSYGVDITSHRGDNWPVLDIVSEAGNVNLIKLLLQHGICPSHRLGSGGRGPLHKASRGGHLEAVKLLVEHGADAEAAAEDGTTPLMEAVRGGNMDVCKFLLTLGVNSNAQTITGSTALKEAIECNYIELARILLNAGADGSNVGQAGLWPPLHIAVEKGLPDIIELILDRGVDINLQARGGFTPLATAAQYGDSDIVKALLERNADTSVLTDDGLGPMSIASQSGHVEIVKTLLKYEVNIDEGFMDRRTPLLWAIIRGHVQTAKLLIDSGADIERMDKPGYTALRYAAEYNRQEILEALILKGAKVNVRSLTGYTPATVATRLGHSIIFQRLLETGLIDIHEADADGRTILFHAAMRGYTDIVRILVSLKPCPSSMSRDRYGATPIIVAARNGHMDALQLMLGLGEASLAERDCFGYNVFAWAEKCGNPGVMNMLVAYARDRGRPRDAAPDRDPTSTSNIRPAHFDHTDCWCDVCGRCTISGTRSMRCPACEESDFLICPDCEGHRVSCRDPTHIWERHQCSCQLNDDE